MGGKGFHRLDPLVLSGRGRSCRNQGFLLPWTGSLTVPSLAIFGAFHLRVTLDICCCGKTVRDWSDRQIR